MSGGRELFVWYRVDRAHIDRLRAEVDAMQRALEARCPGLHARLLIRDDGPGAQTWMETYSVANGNGTGIDAALQALIEARAAPIRPLLDSDRHVEGFDLAGRP